MEVPCRARVGAGDAAPLIAEHTAGDTSLCTLRKFSVASAVSSSVSGLSTPMAGGPYAKHNEFRRAGEVPSVLSAGREPA